MTWTSHGSLSVLSIIVLLWLLATPSVDGLPLFDRRRSAAGLKPSRGRRSLANEEVTLDSRTGYCLAIRQDGTVYGSNPLDPNAVLVRRAVAMGIVVIKGVESGRYLAIDSEGHLIATPNESTENHFLQTVRADGYILYKSRVYHEHNWYVGINHNGHPIRGSRRGQHQHRPIRNGQMFTVHRAS